ncbi:hypothetical protein WJX64_01500 [Leifsonia sp. YIM 134122]|uniref:Uncharacterized protein n=1 Tax=Leifsonia stereocauli TaxID=3134136 RepID=A0ABU9VZQ0_9MICO
MQFAAQYMAETLHRHESTAAAHRLEQRRRLMEDESEFDEDARPVSTRRGWAHLFAFRKAASTRLAHR